MFSFGPYTSPQSLHGFPQQRTVEQSLPVPDVGTQQIIGLGIRFRNRLLLLVRIQRQSGHKQLLTKQ